LHMRTAAHARLPLIGLNKHVEELLLVVEQHAAPPRLAECRLDIARCQFAVTQSTHTYGKYE
jgi:hypothetical protein